MRVINCLSASFLVVQPVHLHQHTRAAHAHNSAKMVSVALRFTAPPERAAPRCQSIMLRGCLCVTLVCLLAFGALLCVWVYRERYISMCVYIHVHAYTYIHTHTIHIYIYIYISDVLLIVLFAYCLRKLPKLCL